MCSHGRSARFDVCAFCCCRATEGEPEKGACNVCVRVWCVWCVVYKCACVCK